MCIITQSLGIPEDGPGPVAQAQPAASVEPVAWLVDWPDEPELGHYLAERPALSGRSRALVFRDAAPVSTQQDVADAELLDWLEALVRKNGMRGTSFDFAKHVEDGQVLEHGFRIMWRHYLGERKPNIRAAINAAMQHTGSSHE